MKDVPKNPNGLLLRKGIFYLHVRIPKDLLGSYQEKKSPFITRSLRTSDRREAISRLVDAKFKIENEFKLRRKVPATGKGDWKAALDDLNEDQREAILISWIVNQDAAATKKAQSIDDDLLAIESAVEAAQDDLATFANEHTYREYQDSSRIALQILKKNNIKLGHDQGNYWGFVKLVNKAQIELATRQIQRLKGEPLSGTGDEAYKSYFDKSLAKNTVTFTQVCDEYAEKARTRMNKRSSKDLEVQLRVLRELFLPNTPLSSISRTECKRVADCIKRMPVNASKKYPNKTVLEQIALAQKNGTPLLHPKRANAYIDRMKAIFQYGIDETYIDWSSPQKLDHLQ